MQANPDRLIGTFSTTWTPGGNHLNVITAILKYSCGDRRQSWMWYDLQLYITVFWRTLAKLEQLYNSSLNWF